MPSKRCLHPVARRLPAIYTHTRVLFEQAFPLHLVVTQSSRELQNRVHPAGFSKEPPPPRHGGGGGSLPVPAPQPASACPQAFIWSRRRGQPHPPAGRHPHPSAISQEERDLLPDNLKIYDYPLAREQKKPQKPRVASASNPSSCQLPTPRRHLHAPAAHVPPSHEAEQRMELAWG